MVVAVLGIKIIMLSRQAVHTLLLSEVLLGIVGHPQEMVGLLPLFLLELLVVVAESKVVSAHVMAADLRVMVEEAAEMAALEGQPLLVLVARKLAVAVAQVATPAQVVQVVWELPLREPQERALAVQVVAAVQVMQETVAAAVAVEWGCLDRALMEPQDHLMPPVGLAEAAALVALPAAAQLVLRLEDAAVFLTAAAVAVAAPVLVVLEDALVFGLSGPAHLASSHQLT